MAHTGRWLLALALLWASQAAAFFTARQVHEHFGNMTVWSARAVAQMHERPRNDSAIVQSLNEINSLAFELEWNDFLQRHRHRPKSLYSTRGQVEICGATHQFATASQELCAALSELGSVFAAHAFDLDGLDLSSPFLTQASVWATHRIDQTPLFAECATELAHDAAVIHRSWNLIVSVLNGEASSSVDATDGDGSEGPPDEVFVILEDGDAGELAAAESETAIIGRPHGRRPDRMDSALMAGV